MGQRYSACALSLVFHPRSPLVPTFRADVRYFEVEMGGEAGSAVSGWFGGGADLTPAYLFDEDVSYFHECYKVRAEDGTVAKLAQFRTGACLSAHFEATERPSLALLAFSPLHELRHFDPARQKICDDHEADLVPSFFQENAEGSLLYRDLKSRCDKYFHLPARGEVRARNMGRLASSVFRPCACIWPARWPLLLAPCVGLAPSAHSLFCFVCVGGWG